MDLLKKCAEVANQICYLTQSQCKYITYERGIKEHATTGMIRSRKRSMTKAEIKPGSTTLEVDALTTRPARQSEKDEEEEEKDDKEK